MLQGSKAKNPNWKKKKQYINLFLFVTRKYLDFVRVFKIQFILHIGTN